MVLENKDEQARNVVAVDRLTEAVLRRFHQNIESRSIRIETELQACSAHVIPSVLDTAITQLVENAIASTPNGGEVNVTLVQGPLSWELEVADSAREKFAKWGNDDATQITPTEPSVELAEQAAIAHGGELRTLNCPMGGLARVLKIPRQR